MTAIQQHSCLKCGLVTNWRDDEAFPGCECEKPQVPEPNTHYWAVIDGKAVVVLYDGMSFAVAGAWEGAVSVDRLVAKIETPHELIGTKLYYDSR